MALVYLPALAATTGDTEASLITAADIRREKPADLVEMLRSRVGLDENNGTITMRGVRGIAIFVDGFASSISELRALQPERVEQMEILRGAASARFGAEAMGGAIAVTTRKDSGGEGVRTNFSQGLDSRLGHFTRLGSEGETAGLRWGLQGETRVTKGSKTVPSSPFPYQITVNEESGKSSLVDGKLAWQSSPVELSINLKHSNNWTTLGRPYWAFEWQVDNLRTQASWHANENFSLEAAWGEERYTNAGSRDRGTGTDAAGLAPENWLKENYRQQEASATLVWQHENSQARLGLNRVRLREYFSNADYDSQALLSEAESVIHKEAIFFASDTPVGAGRLELGLRRDLQYYVSSRVFDSDPFQETTGGGVLKAATSPKIALSWPLDAATRWRGSLGTGFSPPLASQLYNGYISAGSITMANPNLNPERSTTADMSVTQQYAQGDWGLTLFATRWEDKIATRILSYGNPVIVQPQNVGEVMARGLEAQWNHRLNTHWQLTANYTLTRTRVVRNDADPDLVGNQLPDMPQHKANLNLNYDPDSSFSARARLRAIGSAYTDDTNTVRDSKGYLWKKPGYAVLDLAATWRSSDWEFTLALDNALDRDYVTGFFWHGEPRTLRSEITLRF